MIKKDNKNWWREGVIYQIYPRSYMSAANKEVGDLAGIQSKLNYIASLGVDTIWLSPFFTSPMKDYGYDISDYCDVDPMFGSLKDFDKLVAAAHKRGLRVIIDQAYNHTSDQHSWFKESRRDRNNPKADWYVWADPKEDGSPPNNWLAIFGGSGWEWDTSRNQYYFHQFVKEQPDLNFHNPEVIKALLDVARFWLKRKVDGFRLDTVINYLQDKQLRSNPLAERGFSKEQEFNPYWTQNHLYDTDYKNALFFINALRKLTDEYGDKMLVGEIGGSESLEALVLYTQTKERLHTSYTFDFLFDFTPADFRRVFEYLDKELGDGWPCWAFSNHDVKRTASRNQVDARLRPSFCRMMFVLLLSMRGTPCIYQGEELGLPEADIPYEQLHDPFGKTFWPEYKGRDGCRTPMPWQADEANGGFSTTKPWLPVPPEHLALAVDKQEEDQSSMLHFCRRILSWRWHQPVVKQGDMKMVDSPEQVLAFTRTLDKETLFFAFNYSPDRVAFTSSFRGSQFPLDGLIDAKVKGDKIEMSPYGVCILKVE